MERRIERMPSALTWIDHDPAARERALRILSFFQERDSREELGLGAIRDSFADRLFPGTSTIQTRLRYMFFVPWIYRGLERKRVLPPVFAIKARQTETALIDLLLASSDHAGVFGKVAGKSVKRLPSSVYWNGLGVWGIRRIECSQDEYQRHVDKLYKRIEASAGGGEEKDGFSEAGIWHPRLPEPPSGFSDEIENLSFTLEYEEASFLLDRFLESHKESLLTHLAQKCEPVHCEFPWEHPDRDNFSAVQKNLLNYAEFFSVIMHGAAFLYNLMLAERSDREKLKDEHRGNLDKWKIDLQSCLHIDLPLEGLWELTAGQGHTITPQAMDFVSGWCRRVLATRGDVADDPKSRVLVHNRERRLKGVRSRFVNQRALDQWSGNSGVRRMEYRWGNVKTLLSDLHAGLNGGNDAKS